MTRRSAALQLVLALSFCYVALAQHTGTLIPTGDMTTARSYHTATLLLDGRVLLTGGYSVNTTGQYSGPASAELYVPSVLVPVQVVNELRFDRTSVVVGSSFSANFSGSNLTPETFFDVRFTSPESNESAVVLNWQRGLEVSHDVSAGIVAGSYTIIGVRAHEVESDHTGIFFPVSATLTVSTTNAVPNYMALGHPIARPISPIRRWKVPIGIPG